MPVSSITLLEQAALRHRVRLFEPSGDWREFPCALFLERGQPRLGPVPSASAPTDRAPE